MFKSRSESRFLEVNVNSAVYLFGSNQLSNTLTTYFMQSQAKLSTILKVRKFPWKIMDQIMSLAGQYPKELKMAWLNLSRTTTDIKVVFHCVWSVFPSWFSLVNTRVPDLGIIPGFHYVVFPTATQDSQIWCLRSPMRLSHGRILICYMYSLSKNFLNFFMNYVSGVHT